MAVVVPEEEKRRCLEEFIQFQLRLLLHSALESRRFQVYKEELYDTYQLYVEGAGAFDITFDETQFFVTEEEYYEVLKQVADKKRFKITKKYVRLIDMNFTPEEKEILDENSKHVPVEYLVEAWRRSNGEPDFKLMEYLEKRNREAKTITKNQKIEAERFIVALLCDLLKEMAFSTRAKRKKNIDLYIDYSQAIGLTTIITGEEHEKLDFDDYWKMFKDIANNMEEYIDMPIPMTVEFNGDTVDDYIMLRRKK